MVTGQPSNLDAFCFRAKQERTGWNVLLPVPGAGAVDLHALLKQAPEFIGMAAGQATACVSFTISDADVNNLRLMLVLDEAGVITLACVPAKQDRVVVTALAREVLAMTARLWRMSLPEFLALAERHSGKSLAGAMKEKAGPDWKEDVFRAGVERGLQQGRFPLAVLVSKLEPELSDAITYLRGMNLAVSALAADLYESWGIEVLVPKPHQLSDFTGDRSKVVHRPAPPPKSVAPPVTAQPKPAAARPAQTSTAPAQPAAGKPPQDPATKSQNFEPPPGFGKFDVQPEKTRQFIAEPPKAPTEDPKDRVWHGTQSGTMAGRRPPPKPQGKPK